MKKINEIDIHIDKAVVTRISIELKENNKAEWIITASLITKNNKKLTEMHFGNFHWDLEKNSTIPLEADMHARELFKLMQPVIINEINGNMLSLPDKSSFEF